MSIKKEIKFDKKALPQVVFFLFLLMVGILMFFYWKHRRSKRIEEERVVVVATIFPIYDIVQSIVGDNEYVSLSYIVPAGEVVDKFVVTEDVQSEVQEADVVLKAGAGLDDWVDDIADLEKVVDLSEGASLIEIERRESDNLSRIICEANEGEWLEDFSECEGLDEEICITSGGTFHECVSSCRHLEHDDTCSDDCVKICQMDIDIAKSMNTDQENGIRYYPDYWMSVDNARKVTADIYKALIRENADFYYMFNQRYENFIKALDELNDYFEEESELVEEESMIVIGSEAEYTASEFELDVSYRLIYQEEYSKKTLDEFETIFTNLNAKTIYIQPYMNLSSFKEWCWERGIEIRILDSYGGGVRTGNFIDMMRYNIDSINGKALYD